MRARLPLVAPLALLIASLACNTLLPAPTVTALPPPSETHVRVERSATPRASATAEPPTPSLTETTEPLPTGTATAAATPAPPVEGVRGCGYVPGVSAPAEMPASVTSLGTPAPIPVGTLPPNTGVEPSVTARQLRVFNEFAGTIEREYVYPDFNGVDWPALRARYRVLVEGGLTDDDFYSGMNALLHELGDDHSHFESPQEVERQNASFAGNNDFVGIGVGIQAVPETQAVVVLYTFPGGPAAEGGLRAHDSILAVDGQPILNGSGDIRDMVRGEVGTELTLTVARPGEGTWDVTLTRQRVTGPAPVDFCLVPGTRIGYLFLPHLDDETIPGQVRAALRAMTAPGPLDGLILDNRQNGGGASTVLDALLGLFTAGTQGYFVSRDNRRPLDIEAEDVGGSQTVPLVVLIEVETASYGEVLSGVLGESGRATLIGQTTPGNVETLWAYGFEDGSRAWIAREAFQFEGQAVGEWEDTGIVPDIVVPSRWDLFTETNDPAMPAALAVLQGELQPR
jgi:C-terminal peptidase prc